jgi:hypothetical protein
MFGASRLSPHFYPAAFNNFRAGRGGSLRPYQNWRQAQCAAVRWKPIDMKKRARPIACEVAGSLEAIASCPFGFVETAAGNRLDIAATHD